MEAPTAAVTRVLKPVETWHERRLSLAVIDLLTARRLDLVYFGDYDSMPGKCLSPT